MRRYAFTICLNALHHLKDRIEYLLPYFDAWVFVEGVSNNGGSTRWCGEVPAEFHKDYHSIDGTLRWLLGLQKEFGNVKVLSREGLWSSKDEMVCAALDALPVAENGYDWLWEFDADEHWTPRQLDQAEFDLYRSRAKCGQFLCDAYVGPGLLAKGAWGEGVGNPYRRLWKFRGEQFLTHEPPIMVGLSLDDYLTLSQRFKHNSYLFEQDVVFKEKFYRYEGLHAKWLDLQNMTTFPQPLSVLIPGSWGQTATQIVRV
jgi:hypothetical protein